MGADLIHRAGALITGGEPLAAARLLYAAGVDALAALDLGELRALVARLRGALWEVPEFALRYAQILELTRQRDERTFILTRLHEALGPDHPLRPLVRAELLRSELRNWSLEATFTACAELLDAEPDAETLARTLATLGAAYAFRRQPGDVLMAARHFSTAAEAAHELGCRMFEAQSLAGMGYIVLFPEGEDAEAIRVLEEGLEIVVADSILARIMRVNLATVLSSTGRLAASDDHLRVLRQAPRMTGDALPLAWGQWSRARNAAFRNEPSLVKALLQGAESHLADWTDDGEGIEFFAEAAVLAQVVGDESLSAAYLERAEMREDGGALTQSVRRIRLTHEARFGDAALAVRELQPTPQYPLVLHRDIWLARLLRAVALSRSGNQPAAQELATVALADGAALGQDHLLLMREPIFGPEMLRLANAAPSEARVVVNIFGPFSLHVDGEQQALTDQPAMLVQLIVLCGGWLLADQVIEELWPEQDAETGRRRLRNLLNRVRAQAGDILVRDGQRLVLADSQSDFGLLQDALARWTSGESDGIEAVRRAWPTAGPLPAGATLPPLARNAVELTGSQLAAAADELARAAGEHHEPGEQVLWATRAAELRTGR